MSQSTNISLLASMTLTTALIKSLIKKGVISNQDVIGELQALKVQTTAPIIIAEIDNLILSVSTW
jgi:hypothetical protein